MLNTLPIHMLPMLLLTLSLPLSSTLAVKLPPSTVLTTPRSNFPVEVEHCHTVTKVTCTDVNNEIPKTTCEAVETTHVSHAAYAAPIAHAAYGLGY